MIKNLLSAAISDYDKNFASNWHKVFDELASCRDNRMWLAGPTAYVFSLCKVKFAVDLQIRRKQDFDNLESQLVRELSSLSFILITHEHDDHMCLPLMNKLKDTSIHWYIPSDCKRSLVASTGLKEENITWVKSSDSWQIGDLNFRAFYSPHVKEEDNEQFAQCGYEIDSPAGKLLFPGDVRDYNYKGYPDFGEVDLCFSHLWCGNDAINSENYLPMLKDFVRFNARFDAKKYFLCHLYEIGREERYMWNYAHAGLAMDEFFLIKSESTVEVPRIGHSYCLDFNTRGDSK